MSRDSDTAMDGRALDESRKARHADWCRVNTGEIEASGIEHASKNSGESLLFRERGKPKVDFFPSTGRWRVAGQTRTYRGGAVAFLAWYRYAEVKL